MFIPAFGRSIVAKNPIFSTAIRIFTWKIGYTIKNNFIKGVYHDSDKFIMILDMNKVFATDEIINMNKIAEKVKA